MILSMCGFILAVPGWCFCCGLIYWWWVIIYMNTSYFYCFVLFVFYFICNEPQQNLGRELSGEETFYVFV